MSRGPPGWWELLWLEGSPLIVVVAAMALLIGIPLAQRVSRTTAFTLAVALVTVALATLAWGRWVTGLRGMAPIWWGSVGVGLALGWLGAIGAAGRSRPPLSP